MWQLWLFGVLFAVVTGLGVLLGAWAQYMGSPDPIHFGKIVLAAGLGSGFATLLAMGVASVF